MVKHLLLMSCIVGLTTSASLAQPKPKIIDLNTALAKDAEYQKLDPAGRLRYLAKLQADNTVTAEQLHPVALMTLAAWRQQMAPEPASQLKALCEIGKEPGSGQTLLNLDWITGVPISEMMVLNCLSHDPAFQQADARGRLAIVRDLRAKGLIPMWGDRGFTYSMAMQAIVAAAKGAGPEKQVQARLAAVLDLGREGLIPSTISRDLLAELPSTRPVGGKAGELLMQAIGDPELPNKPPLEQLKRIASLRRDNKAIGEMVSLDPMIGELFYLHLASPDPAEVAKRHKELQAMCQVNQPLAGLAGPMPNMPSLLGWHLAADESYDKAPLIQKAKIAHDLCLKAGASDCFRYYTERAIAMEPSPAGGDDPGMARLKWLAELSKTGIEELSLEDSRKVALAEHLNSNKAWQSGGPKERIAYLALLEKQKLISVFTQGEFGLPESAQLVCADEAFMKGDPAARKAILQQMQKDGLIHTFSAYRIGQWFDIKMQ